MELGTAPKNLLGLIASCLVGTFGVLVVWGCLAAWQLGLRARIQRIEHFGTQELADLGWYVEDRRASWLFGNFGPLLEDAPEILLTSNRMLPRVIGFAPAQLGITFAVLSVGICACSVTGVLLGRFLARRLSSRAYGTELWNSLRVRERMRGDFWTSSRIGCLTACVAAAGAWYTTFDRNAQRIRIDEYFDIGVTPLLSVLSICFSLALVCGSRGWTLSLARSTTAEERFRARHDSGLCDRCGYPRVGLQTRACPECGKAFAALSPPRRLARFLPALFHLLVVTGWAGVGVFKTFNTPEYIRDYSNPSKAIGSWSLYTKLLWQWAGLRSDFTPYELSGRLPQHRVAAIGSNGVTVLARWRYTDKLTGDIEICTAKIPRGGDIHATPEWTTTLCIYDATKGAHEPRDDRVDFGALQLRMESPVDAAPSSRKIPSPDVYFLRFKVRSAPEYQRRGRPDTFEILPDTETIKESNQQRPRE